MPQNLLDKLIFALFSGFTEFLPVSAHPHQMLYQIMTGFEQNDPWLVIAIRLGTLTALFVCCGTRIKRLMKENRLSKRSHRRRSRQPDLTALLDVRVLKTAMIPLVISVLFYRRAAELVNGVAILALVLVINGVILFIPRLISQGNKDGRSMSRLDSLLMGLGGTVAVIPGLSRIGSTTSVAQLRGVDREYALDTALLLSIPVLLGLLIFDVYAAVAAQASLSALALLLYLLAAALSFGGAWLGIIFVRFLAVKAGFTGFSYYSWGLALFSFIIYLMF